MFRIICLLIGYGFGLLQTSYIMGRLNGIDIREHGSKNAGFTNTNRVLGMKKGAVVFIIDVAKAAIAFTVATVLYNATYDGALAGGTFFETNYILPGLYAGLGVVLGHCFPFYLGFKGGKGVASTLGLILMLDWRIAIITFAVGIIIVAVTKFISVASLTMSALVPILMYIFITLDGGAPHRLIPPLMPLEGVWLTAALCAFIWFLHRDNIKRLCKKEENKFSFRRKPE